MEFWYLWVILIIVAVLTVFVLHKASLASQAAGKTRAEIMAELEKLKALKDKYKNATEELLKEADAAEMLEGANAVLQAKIEKSENPEQCFLEFTKPQQYMYTLKYFLEDSETDVKYFLNHNGAPLTTTAASALLAIGEEGLSKAVATYYQDQKEKGDIVTDEALQIEYEKKAKPLFQKDRILENAKAYMQKEREEIFF